jgi:hypothetical protein
MGAGAKLDLDAMAARCGYRGRNSNSALSFLADRTRWAANLLPRLEKKFSINEDLPE